MILKIGICDDDRTIIKQLKEYLEYYSFAYNIDFETRSFTHAKDLLSCYHSTGNFHILFLDVEMPDINGIELASRIRQIPDPNVKIVFISSYPEYMKQSFQVHAYEYLTKPLERDIFKKEMNRMVTDIIEQMSAKLILTVDGQKELIFLDELLYIKCTASKSKRLDFVLDDRVIHSHGTIADYEKMLAGSGFICPSRSYLIHLKFVQYIRKDELVLTNNHVIPISRRKEKAIRDYFNQQLLTLAKRR